MDDDMVPLRDICDTNYVKLPRGTFRRDLEYFEGSLLAEYWVLMCAGIYLHKWCDCNKDRTINRYLIVESSSRAIEAYLNMRISMHDLLTHRDDQVFLADFCGM